MGQDAQRRADLHQRGLPVPARRPGSRPSSRRRSAHRGAALPGTCWAATTPPSSTSASTTACPGHAGRPRRATRRAGHAAGPGRESGDAAAARSGRRPASCAERARTNASAAGVHAARDFGPAAHPTDRLKEAGCAVIGTAPIQALYLFSHGAWPRIATITCAKRSRAASRSTTAAARGQHSIAFWRRGPRPGRCRTTTGARVSSRFAAPGVPAGAEHGGFCSPPYAGLASKHAEVLVVQQPARQRLQPQERTTGAHTVQGDLISGVLPLPSWHSSCFPTAWG